MRRAGIALVALVALAAAVIAPAASAEETSLGAGAWSWFGDPRAVTHSGQHTRTYVGWVDWEGDVNVSSWDHGSGERTTTQVRAALQRDDHANPSLLVRPDGRLTVFYSKHNGPNMFHRTTLLPEDVSAFGPEQEVATNVTPTSGQPNRGYTYPNPVYLSAEDRTYLFWRGGNYGPTFSSQDEGSATWAAARNLLPGNSRDPIVRPYIKYHSNGTDTIHFAYTNGHPREVDANLYYARYRAGVVERADGTDIGTLAAPIDPTAGDPLYEGPSEAWVHDVAADAAGRPVVVFATFPSTEAHRYNYARWTGSNWAAYDFAPAGGSISADGREAHYSGGVTLDHEDPSRVYLSRQAGDAWEVEVWTTPDGGESWFSQPVTSGSTTKNVRPVSPRGLQPLDADLAVIWMRGAYNSYLTYETSLTALLRAPSTPQPPATRVGPSAGPAATAATPAPLRARLRIGSAAVRVDRRGRTRLPVRCLAAPGDLCRFSGTLGITVAPRARATRNVRIGRLTGSIRAGRGGTVAAQLSSGGLRRLKRARRLRALASGVVRNRAGARTSARWRLRLVRPR